MPSAASIVPKRHIATFVYGPKRIPFHFWSKRAGDTAPDTIVFLGTGQIGRIPLWVAQSLPAGTIVVQGLPHWHSHASGNDLEDFANAYAMCAHKTALETFDIRSLHLIGASQGTPSTIWLANQFQDSIGNVALLQPMGLNTSSFGNADRARFQELRRRSLRTLLQFQQSVLHDFRNLYITSVLMAVILAGLRHGATVNQYTAGISHSMLEQFEQLAKHQAKHHRSLTLFLGDKDRIFPVAEIRQALQTIPADNIRVRIIPGLTHASLGLKAATSYLPSVVAAVRQKV